MMRRLVQPVWPRYSGRWGGFLLLALFLACGPGDALAPRTIGSERYDQLRSALAVSGKYYYEFRLSGQVIALCHSGVDISRYPTGPVQVGAPRVLWFHSGDSDPWVGQTWPAAALDPPLFIERVKIIPGNEATRPTPSAAGVVPPTLEELMPVPPSYRIVFPDTRCIQVDLKGAIAGKVKERDSFEAWWGDFQEGIGLKPSHRLRLRVELDAKDGAGLYRSFPESPTFLILP